MKKLFAFLMALVMTVSFAGTVAEARNTEYEQKLAIQLKNLGLLSGVSENDFALDKPLSKYEAVVMLIRLVGEEENALQGSFGHPFTDVPEWADNYVGYAYEKGIVNGESEKVFGKGNVDAKVFLSLVLRTLGYSDKDFSWENPFELSHKTGILPKTADVENFVRADAVAVIHKALKAYRGDDGKLMMATLNGENIREKLKQYYNVIDPFVGSAENSKQVLTAEQIYAKCTPAVVFITNFDENGEKTDFGSGFFVDNEGTVVTNYHVIENAERAVVRLWETGEEFPVEGVYDYNSEQDWAVLKTGLKNTSYIETGFPETVAGGAPVYTIGNPRRMTFTISEGIVSNPCRLWDEYNETFGAYIQISAPVSPGNSGGPLLNRYGEVVGINTASKFDGQNLNFAVPIGATAVYSRENTVSFEEIKLIEEQKTGTITDDFYKKIQQKAFECLKNYICEKGTEKDGEACVEFVLMEDDTEYSFKFYENENRITVSEKNEYMGSNDLRQITITTFSQEELFPDKRKSTALFRETETSEGTTRILGEGKAEIVAENFNAEEPAVFTEYAGEADHKSDYECFLNMGRGRILKRINKLLAECVSDGQKYSVKDFGYNI